VTEPETANATTPRSWWIGLFVLLAGLCVGGWFLFVNRPPRLHTAEGAEFVPNEACARCHEEEHRHWKGSHHDLAMDEATPEFVLGDFDDASYDHFGQVTRFFQRDDRYFVNAPGPDGQARDYEVKYVFGVTPLQQYLIEMDGGRLQCLQVSWDTEKKRWFHIQTEPIEPDDALHWTGLQFNWNFMCAECHSTNLQRGYDPKTNTYDTTWSDIDVGCQACHGPGSNHVAWAERAEKRGSTPHPDDPLGLAVRFKTDGPDVQIEHCARCHSRRTIVAEPYEFGRPFLDHYAPRLLVEPLYHADGQIRDEVYVYASLLQAKKHSRGVRCTNCHDAHSARLIEEGDALCVRCHQQEPPEEFPTLRKATYDTKDHHFHPLGKPGSFCVDCHMPPTTYMGVDPRNDHSFRVPRPDLSVAIGTPNACNMGCHEDKDAAWSAQEIEKRFPDSNRDLHYGVTFTAARRGMAEAFQPLCSLAMDVEQSAIVRATAVYYLRRYEPSRAAPVVALMLGDDDGLIRSTAIDTLSVLVPRRAPPALKRQKAQMISPLLEDPLRLVRTEAARALSDVPRNDLPADSRTAFDHALEEFVARQEAITERPGAHLNLAVLAEAQGDIQQAEVEYRRAIELDSRFLPARFNLANFLNARGRNDAAEEVLQEVVELAPENGEAWYSLGLLQAERKRNDAAAASLARAVRLLPNRARVRYNYAQILRMTGEDEMAARVLAEARRLAPSDPDILTAIIVQHIQRGAYDEAEALLGTLTRIAPPRSPIVRQLRAEIAAARGR